MNGHIFQYINQFALRYPLLDKAGIFAGSYLGYLLMFFVLIPALINARRYWKMSLGALISGFAARIFVVEPIRRLFPVTRPFVAETVNQLIERSPSASFPSGHTAFFFTLSSFVFFYTKKMVPPMRFRKTIIAILITSSTAIGFARIFCGIHWPSDIIAGAFVGLLCGWVGASLAGK